MYSWKISFFLICFVHVKYLFENNEIRYWHTYMCIIQAKCFPSQPKCECCLSYCIFSGSNFFEVWWGSRDRKGREGEEEGGDKRDTIRGAGQLGIRERKKEKGNLGIEKEIRYQNLWNGETLMLSFSFWEIQRNTQLNKCSE